MTTRERFAALKIKTTQCDSCFGCNRLEDMDFSGDSECQNYRDGTTNKDEQIILARKYCD